MEEKKSTYRCSKCDKTKTVPENAEVPECCEKVMVKDPLTACSNADHPEMARNTNDDFPCDDSTGKV